MTNYSHSGMYGALAAALLAGGVAAAAPAASGDKADTVQSIIDVPDARNSPGCATAVVEDGKTIAAATSGVADITTHRPLDGDTLFYAASVSKQFTAVLIATLVEQGKVGLDDDVRKWIPELPKYAVPITPRMLLHHTAGIRDWLDLVRFAGVKNFGRLSRQRVLELLYRQSATNFEPGSRFSYSNGGYLLLSEIVARASGMPFAQFAQQTIFAPLGMQRTFFMADAPPNATNVAHGYIKGEHGFALWDTYPWISGSGGMMTSVNDLARFERDVQVTHRVWTDGLAKIMLDPGKLTDGSPALGPNGLGYAAGLTVGQRKGQFWVEHGGGADGFAHLYARIPARHLGVILMCNRVDMDRQAEVDALFTAVSPGINLSDAATSAPSMNRPARSRPAAGIGTAAATKVAGTYYSKDLEAKYVLTATSQGALHVVMSSPWAAADNRFESPDYVLLEDGSWGESIDLNNSSLAFDADGFTLRAGGTSIRFQKKTSGLR